MISWRYIKVGLKKYYTAPVTTTFKQFRSGLIYFMVGFGTILATNNMMQASALQEAIMLFGAILAGIGFFMAMLAQSRFLISRIVQFWIK